MAASRVSPARSRPNSATASVWVPLWNWLRTRGILCAHHLGKDLLQLCAAGIPQAVAGGAQHIGRGHLGIRKGFQHFELVKIADLLHMAEVGLAQLHSLFVQRQNFGFVIEKSGSALTL